MLTQDYNKIINSALIKLKREDLINKVKVHNRSFYWFRAVSLYDALISNYGQVCGAIFIKQIPTFKFPPINTINLFRHFNHVKEKYKVDVVLHELCHVVNETQDNDSNDDNGGHGKTFWELSDKLCIERPSLELMQDDVCYNPYTFTTLYSPHPCTVFADLIS